MAHSLFHWCAVTPGTWQFKVQSVQKFTPFVQFALRQKFWFFLMRPGSAAGIALGFLKKGQGISRQGNKPTKRKSTLLKKDAIHWWRRGFCSPAEIIFLDLHIFMFLLEICYILVH